MRASLTCFKQQIIAVYHFYYISTPKQLAMSSTYQCAHSVLYLECSRLGDKCIQRHVSFIVAIWRHWSRSIFQIVCNWLVVPHYYPNYPDNKVHGANMGPIWGRQGPGGPHVGTRHFTVRVVSIAPPGTYLREISIKIHWFNFHLQKVTFENIVCKISIILFEPEYVINSSLWFFKAMPRQRILHQRSLSSPFISPVYFVHTYAASVC